MEAKGDEGWSAAHTSDGPTAAGLMLSVQEHFVGIKTRLSAVGTSRLTDARRDSLSLLPSLDSTLREMWPQQRVRSMQVLSARSRRKTF